MQLKGKQSPRFETDNSTLFNLKRRKPEIYKVMTNKKIKLTQTVKAAG